MDKSVLLFIFGVIINNVSTQTIEQIPSSLLSSTSTCNQWEELLPALKMIKSTSGIKKERLLNVVKIINFLLSEDVERKESDQILEDKKEAEEFPCPEMPDIDTLVEERLKPIQEALEEKSIGENIDLKKDAPKNKTADFSKILSKISAALARVKENNENGGTLNPAAIMPIFKSKNRNDCKSNNNQPVYETSSVGNSNQAIVNAIPSNTMFNIPCQRASDILEETATIPIPKESYCDIPSNVNLNSILKNPKLKSDNLPFKIVPNSVSCVDADDSIAILFKPKKISLMQVYGNLLKKITITVLVPYHVSKIAL